MTCDSALRRARIEPPLGHGCIMDQIALQEQDRLLELMHRHDKRLKAYANVRAVDIGFEFTAGRRSGRLAIRAHVRRKLPDSALTDAERLPDEIDGIPVDVIQSNPVPDLDFRNSRQDPVVGGINIGNNKVGLAGTLSLVFDIDTLRPLALSCWHVLVADLSVEKDPIVQPIVTTPPGGSPPPDNFLLGHLFGFDKDLDAAISSISDRFTAGDVEPGARRISPAIAELPSPAIGSRSPVVGMQLIKSGVGTGVTHGLLDGTDGVQFSIVVDSAFPPQGRIADHGDSGALWLNLQDFAAVGVHFASDPDAAPGQDRAFGNSIDKIGEKLKIFVLDTVAVAKASIGGECHVIARTRPLTQCFLKVIYPKGRTSSARGLGAKQADDQGFVEWDWLIGTSTGRKPGVPMRVIVTLDGAVQEVDVHDLEGTPDTTH